jgi:hypothetical protein
MMKEATWLAFPASETLLHERNKHRLVESAGFAGTAAPIVG